MVMTSTERQARYRERALKDPDGLLLTRVNTMLSPHASTRLKRLQKVTGWTQRECIEQAINLLASEQKKKPEFNASCILNHVENSA